MSTPVTLEDIYQLFQRSQAEADRRFAEADRRAAEADHRAAEADHRAAEADRRAAEADRRAAESKAEFDRRMADFDRRMAESKAEDQRRAAEAERRAVEADLRTAKAEAIAAQANQAVNNLSSRWGQFVENLVAPAVVRLFQEQNIAVHSVSQRVKGAWGGQNLEIDILAQNNDVVVAVEVKSRLTQKMVQHCLQNLDNFKTVFPHYQNYQLYGAVAAIEIDGGVDIYASNQGLFVIKQSGESVEISNKVGFSPRTW